MSSPAAILLSARRIATTTTRRRLCTGLGSRPNSTVGSCRAVVVPASYHRIRSSDCSDAIKSRSQNFSTAASAELATKESPPTDETRKPTHWLRPKSALEKANMSLITPGHALSVLQIHGAGGENIRRSDFVDLCNSSRPGKKKDAKVIATALRDFKRINDIVLHLEGARAAMNGMMRSSLPNYKVVYGKLRVNAALHVAEQVLDETTGLYYAAETELIDDVLAQLHQGLLEMKEHGIPLQVKTVDGEGEDADVVEGGTEKEVKTVDEEGGDANVDEGETEDDVVKDAMRVNEEIIKLLVKRRTYPENKMKKRASRKYRKLIQVTDGPGPATMKLASDICLLIAGPSETRKRIISPYTAAWWTKAVDPEILQMLEDAEKKLVEEAAELAAQNEENIVDDEKVTEDGSQEEDSESTESGVNESR